MLVQQGHFSFWSFLVKVEEFMEVVLKNTFELWVEVDLSLDHCREAKYLFPHFLQDLVLNFLYSIL